MLESNDIGEKIIPYQKLFDEQGNLYYRKDMSISIFECLDKVMKNETSKPIWYSELSNLIEICETPDKILEGIYINYDKYQYFDPEFLKTQRLLDLMCFEDNSESFLYIAGWGEISSTSVLTALHFRN